MVNVRRKSLRPSAIDYITPNSIAACSHGVSRLIYDKVPGGAGHARQLSDRVIELVEEAYRVVDGHCGCGEETYCYGCIANYYNQSKQAKLSRGAAKRILGSLLGY